MGSNRLSVGVLLLGTILSKGECFLGNTSRSTPLSIELRQSSSSLHNSSSGEEIVQRWQAQLVKLRQRDRSAKSVQQQELEICYEDDHIIVVNKPPRVLCVPSERGIPSLAQTVFERCQNSGNNTGKLQVHTMDQMVVHRLGMDTSGLVVFAKTIESLRGLNTLFRTRQVTRQYEALVCGHVENADPAGEDGEYGEFGWITLPLMRDWEKPPFMRISTEESQRILVGLDPAVVGKRLLEAPKQSVTEYQLVGKEYLSSEGSSKDGPGLPVTRLTLTAMTGRTHQLNVHLAAFGHPIVGDQIYGFGGDALPNGGLGTEHLDKQNPKRAPEELQVQIAELVVAEKMNMCVHAKRVSFRHPVTKQDVSVSSSAPF